MPSSVAATGTRNEAPASGARWPGRAWPARALVWGAVAACLLAGCSGAGRLDSPEAGRTVSFEPGAPDFDLEAIATWRDDVPGIDLYLGIPARSLFFVRVDSSTYRAVYERRLRVVDEATGTFVREDVETDTVRVSTYEATQSFQPVVRQERQPVTPGTYVVHAALTDAASGTSAARSQRVEVAEVERGRVHVSNLRLEGQVDGVIQPMVALHVPAGIDSLRAVAEFYNAQDAGVTVTLRLLQFPSDTTVAVPPYGLDASRGSIVYRGIRFDQADTLQVTRRRLVNVEREAEVEFALPHLDPGIYRFELTAHTADAAGVALVRRRDISVKPAAFPRIVDLREMVDALTYIATEAEMEHLRAAATLPEMKRRFDAFWGSLVANREVAANLIKRYYERVEEANLRFTTYKQGWKTDRGMVFVVMGPPLYVEDRISAQTWYYSYDEQDPQRTFIFERVPSSASGGLFQHFVLERALSYHQSWMRTIDRWRNGNVL